MTVGSDHAPGAPAAATPAASATATAAGTAQDLGVGGLSAARAALLALLAAGLTGAAVILGLKLIATTSMPAFSTSHVLRALTTLGATATVALSLLPLARARWRASAWGAVVSALGLGGFVATILAIPLAATPLYLHGVSVDQQFRTQFLTRATDTAGLGDMAYLDLPTYYPAGWFWLGGRFANGMGLSGWEAFKPWSILSLAVTAAVSLILWRYLLGPIRGTILATVSVLYVVTFGSPEPYGAVVLLLALPLVLLTWRALWTRTTGAWLGQAATAAALLGLSATLYTLYTGIIAVIVTLLTVAATGFQPRTRWLRLWLTWLIIAAGSGALALLTWAPFLLARLTGTTTAEGGTATHYLPEAGAQFPLPMFHGGLIGALSLLGFVWLVWRSFSSRTAQALGLAAVAMYLWVGASLALTAIGTTLLSFRVEVPLTLTFVLAGTLGAIECVGWAADRAAGDRPAWEAARLRRQLTVSAIAVAAVLGIGAIHAIPDVLKNEIYLAYADTDGAGERADRRAAGAEAHYPAVHELIQGELQRPERDTVVLTTEYSFQAFYPYHQFQAISSHYANPLGDYSARNAEIARWAEAAGPEEFLATLAASPWRAPDVFIMRGGQPSDVARAVSGDQAVGAAGAQGGNGAAADGAPADATAAADRSPYTLRMSEDVYPNDPNVRRFVVEFPATLFESSQWSRHPVGPLTVFIRR